MREERGLEGRDTQRKGKREKELERERVGEEKLG